MKFITLNNGMIMPQLGTGTNTFGKENKQFMGKITGDTTELLSAIALGYRLIDTAVVYRNERVVGDAVKQSGLDRKDFFITSKLPQNPDYNRTDDLVRQTIDASLKALQSNYMDLYLIHFPLETLADNARVWKVLEEAVNLGKIKSIGVSNFNIEQLQDLLKHAKIKPVVNQFLSYPGHEQQALIDYCKSESIIPEAYQSLAKLDEQSQTLLHEIGQKYQKTGQQVVLNYQISKGMIVIPKSHNPKHQQSNIDVFDFELSKEDFKLVEQLNNR